MPSTLTKGIQGMNTIQPEAFIAWLTTQFNSRGTLYLERVAYHYARYLRTAPLKLDLPLSIDERIVFVKRTPAEFNSLVQAFTSAPNYKPVNADGHQTFSAALKCFARYLEFLSEGGDPTQNSAVAQRGGTFVTQTRTVPVDPINNAVSYVDFANTGACSGSSPVVCFISGTNIPFVGNWRNLIVAITEFCISKFPEKTGELKSRWFSNYSNTPYFLSEKPALSGKKVSNGYWINVHYSISQLLSIMAGLLRYCGVSLNDIEIVYSPNSSEDAVETISEVSNDNTSSEDSVPESVIDVLRTDYANGFRFDNTALRLLSSKAGVEVDEPLQSALKRQMFHRADDVYFLLDIVTDAVTRKELVGFANALLDEYGCFEISEFYVMYADKLNPKCIGGAEDFERFYSQICSSDVRCVAAPYIWNRIARRRNSNVWGQFETIAKKIIAVANEEFGGVASENDLHLKFCAFSTDLLAKIIKHRAGNDILRVEINGIVCYQTLDALGLPGNFSDVLSDILYRFDDLGLTPNEEALHTALSLALGVNFKEEYNIPDQETYRRLVAVHYKAEPPREWKGSIFREVMT